MILNEPDWFKFLTWTLKSISVRFVSNAVKLFIQQRNTLKLKFGKEITHFSLIELVYLN